MTTRQPFWIEKQAIVSLHDRSLALHGGPGGFRDEGLLEFALQRPQNRFFYEGETSIAVLAATYAVGVASNPPFVDGNKRAAYAALILFLAQNGSPLGGDRVEAINTMLGVAAGEIDIDALADWIRDNSTAAL